MSNVVDKEDRKTFKCGNNLYNESDNKYICLSDQEICMNKHPYLISGTKECVQVCKLREYNILYNNECKSWIE